MARTTGSDELYRLIHSLTTEEKGYFKKFAKRHTTRGTASLQLFDAINRQSEFEEKTLKRKFKDYPVMKVQLYDAILNSTLVYEQDNSLQTILQKQLLHIFFLQRKGLTDKAIQLTLRGLKKAEDGEIFWLEAEYRRTYHTLAKLGVKASEREKFNKEVFSAMRLVQQKQSEKEELYETFQKLLNLDQLKNFNNKSLETFARQLSLDELAKDKGCLSVTAERMRWGILDRYYALKNDYEEQYRCAKAFYTKEKKLWEKEIPIKSYDLYIKAIRGVIRSCLDLKRFSEALLMTEQMKSIRSGNELYDIENDLCYHVFRQYIFWGSGKHCEGERFGKENFPVAVLERYGAKYKMLQLVCHKMKILFEFSNSNHREIFKSIADFEALDLKKNAPSYYKSCELLKLLLQVELENYELLRELVPNTLKHLSAYGLTSLEKQIFFSFRKVNSINRKAILSELFSKLNSSKGKISLFSMLNLKAWLQAQLENKKLYEVFVADEM